MRILSLLILVLGVALAGGGAYYANELAKAQKIATVQTEAMVPIVVARRPLEAEQSLGPDDVTLKDWPAGVVPNGAFTSIEALLGADQQSKRIVKRSMFEGEAVVASRVYDLGDLGGVERRIPPGWRAVSLRIDAVTGVSGFVKPDDIVDIVLTSNVADRLTSRVILEAVRVLAIDQDMEIESTGPRLGSTVTVLVTARDAQVLDVARQTGNLSLFLRSPDDQSDPDIPRPPVTTDDLPGSVQELEKERPFVWLNREGKREKVYLD